MADDESIQSVFQSFSKARERIRSTLFESSSKFFIGEKYEPAEMTEEKRVAEELGKLLAGDAHVFTLKNKADVSAVEYLFKHGGWSGNKVRIDPELNQSKIAEIKKLIDEIKPLSGNKRIQVLSPPPPAN